VANWRKKKYSLVLDLKKCVTELIGIILKNIEIIDVKKIYKNAEISFISKKEKKLLKML
jgi:hypothetical protein